MSEHLINDTEVIRQMSSDPILRAAVYSAAFRVSDEIIGLGQGRSRLLARLIDSLAPIFVNYKEALNAKNQRA